MDDSDRISLIQTEYEQTGEEYRTRHRLLHNSYYLFVVSLLLFAGAAVPILNEPFKLGLLFLVGSGASFVLGFAILTHYVERRSASALITRTEQAIEEIANEDVDHDVDIQRPLSIQYHVDGQNVDMNNSGEMVVLPGGDYDVIWTPPDFSAKTLGQLVILFSIVQALSGVVLLFSVFAP